MRLREALKLCTDSHWDDWIDMPSGQYGRPAVGMVASLHDPGGEEPELRALEGHTIAVYEPDPRLSIVWPLYEDDRGLLERDRDRPAWVDQESHDWKCREAQWAVILLCGAPVWQVPVRYLTWGSGVGGYVAEFRPAYTDGAGEDIQIKRWDTTRWEVGFARLLNKFSVTAREFGSFDPTERVVPEPDDIHPIDARIEGIDA